MVISPEEKRKFPRIKLYTPLHYQIRGIPEFYNTVSDDISLGGIGFMNNKFVAPQTPVTLEINLLSRVLRPTGRIAWSWPLAHSDRYRLGVEFVELDPGERNYLSDYIDMQRGKL